MYQVILNILLNMKYKEHYQEIKSNIDSGANFTKVFVANNINENTLVKDVINIIVPFNNVNTFQEIKKSNFYLFRGDNIKKFMILYNESIGPLYYENEFIRIIFESFLLTKQSYNKAKIFFMISEDLVKELGDIFDEYVYNLTCARVIFTDNEIILKEKFGGDHIITY